MYDIVEDKPRTKVAKACEKAGIYRVQYSVFLGDLNKTQRKELKCIIEELIDAETDKVYIFPMCKEDFLGCASLAFAIIASVYIFPMCKEDFLACELMGQAFDPKLITDEVKAFFI